MFPRVEASRFSQGGSEGVVDHGHLLGDFGVLVFLVVGVELGNGATQGLQVVLELFLLGGQLLLELRFLQL